VWGGRRPCAMACMMSAVGLGAGVGGASFSRRAPSARPAVARPAFLGGVAVLATSSGRAAAPGGLRLAARAAADGPGGGGDGGGKRKGRGKGRGRPEKEDDGFKERVVEIKRVAKAVKGGTKISFRAVVAVGDGKGTVGVGSAKSAEVVNAVKKAVIIAKKETSKVPISKGNTIPHRVQGVAGGATVMLRPASEGTGIIAGGSVRNILELAGYENMLGKQLGSNNKLNNARAAIEGLQQLRTVREVAKQRGLPAEHFFK